MTTLEGGTKMDRRLHSLALLGATAACLWASPAAVRAQGTKTLQPVNGYAVRINPFLPGTLNLALEDDLSVMHRQGNDENSLISFDLSSIPANVTITSATLTLWADQSIDPGGDFGLATKVFRVTQTWVNWQVTWVNASGIRPSDFTAWKQPGGDFVGVNQGFIPYATSSLGIPDYTGNSTPGIYQMNLDVTDLVNEWYKAIYPNYGLILVGEEGNGLHFHADRGANPALYPTLTVNYQ
jgi:hypothetical protein